MKVLAVAQKGVLAGKVTDKKTSEGVIGATVLVTSSIEAAPVNVDGTYNLPLEPGAYSITMTYVGYKPLTFPSVDIKSGETTNLNGLMKESAISLNEVTVTGAKKTSTEVALIQDLKNSEVVVSGRVNALKIPAPIPVSGGTFLRTTWHESTNPASIKVAPNPGNAFD